MTGSLDRVEEFAEAQTPISEAFIQELHRIVIVRSRGRRGSRSQYRTTECPVVDTITRRIDYAPPEPIDVPQLMQKLVEWLSSKAAQQLPAPIRAAILTHRFLSIHPFDDGNGRTGRLLATAELWRSGYRMRGFFSFEEYFSANRELYYQNLQMGLPVNFYDGRHEERTYPLDTLFCGDNGTGSDRTSKESHFSLSRSHTRKPPLGKFTSSTTTSAYSTDGQGSRVKQKIHSSSVQ